MLADKGVVKEWSQSETMKTCVALVSYHHGYIANFPSSPLSPICIYCCPLNSACVRSRTKKEVKELGPFGASIIFCGFLEGLADDIEGNGLRARDLGNKDF